MIRPIITAFLEYLLAYLVFKYGKKYKIIITALLFFLASYQLGEVAVFLTNGTQAAFKIAYVSTTMLPPLGLLLVQKVLRKKLGYIIFQIVSLFFIGFMIFMPVIIRSFEFGQFCIRIFESDPVLSTYWVWYYQGTLLFTIIAAFVGWMFTKNTEAKNDLKWILIAYLSFDLSTIIIGYLNPWFWHSSASLMCALAVIAAFILAKISFQGNFLKILHLKP